MRGDQTANGIAGLGTPPITGKLSRDSSPASLSPSPIAKKQSLKKDESLDKLPSIWPSSRPNTTSASRHSQLARYSGRHLTDLHSQCASKMVRNMHFLTPVYFKFISVSSP